MALVGKFPGVYPEITDLSQVVTSNSIVSCGYVGEAEFGPINTPTLVNNLRGYTAKFGELSPKYGYMGYSLAVAQDSINSHYVVRVVNEDTARYGFTRVPFESKSYTTEEEKTWLTEYKISVKGSADTASMTAINKDSSAAFTSTGENDAVLQDTKSAMLIVAENPNNKKYKVRITDSTINTNKNYQASQVLVKEETVTNQETQVVTKTGNLLVEVTVPEMFTVIDNTSEQIFNVDDKVVISNSTLPEINGKFSITNVKDTYTATAAIKTGGSGYKVGDILYVTGMYIDDQMGEAKVYITKVNENGVVTGLEFYTKSTSNTAISEATYETRYVVQPDGAAGEGLTVDITTTKKLNIVCYKAKAPKDGLPAEQPTIEKTRIQKYPDTDETTFALTVYETVGRTTTAIENYPYCTLYEAKDNFGNSMFVEDVVNGKSDIIKVFVNTGVEDVQLIPSETLVYDESNKLLGYGYLSLDNGTSGDKPTSKELVDAWSLYNDRSRTNVTLLLNSGYVTEGDVSYQNAMLTTAEKRRDCFCLFDTPSTISQFEDVIDWRQNVNSMNNYRGALFAPWPVTYNAVQGKRNFTMCPSAYIAKIMGAGIYPWVAAAGPNRGTLSSSVVTPMGLTAYYNETEGGELYDKQVNCFIKDSIGYANWGQKTLQQKPSALDRINVARTVIYIETTLKDAARYHLFENNTAYERMQITLQFSQFLDTVLNAEGIQRYQVICDDSNNTPYIIAQNQLVIDIYLWPTYTTEFIQLNTVVMGPEAEVTVSTNA